MRNAWLLAGILGGAIPLLAQDSAPPTQTLTASEATASEATASNAASPEDAGEARDVPSFEDSVVVTASLDEAQPDELTATVTVIRRPEIDDRQATTIQDLLRTVPGLAVVQSGSPGNVTSLFSRGTSSTQTLVLWNGMVLNDPYFGGFDWAFLDAGNADRVEVVRGPLSTLFGSDAVGGAVQVLTRRQQDRRLRLEGGQRSYARGAFSGGGGTSSLHADLFATYRTSEGELTNDFYDGRNLVARGEWQASARLLLGWIARFNDAELGIPRSGATATPNRRQSSTSRDLALPLDLLAGGWQIEGHLSRVDTAFEFRDPDASFSLNDTDVERLRGRLVASRDLSGGFWLGFGGEWQDNEVTNVNTFGTNLDGARHENRAAFAQARYHRDAFLVEAALRQDDHEVFGSELSPSLGLAVRLATGTRLRASYGEGFRAPSLGELFFPFSGNPELGAETNESYELALDHHSGRWRFTVAGFDSRQRNLIEFDPATFVNVNRGRTRSRGVEGEVALRADRLGLTANFTYLDAEDEDTGEPLARRPKESGSLLLTYRPGPAALTLTARYVGRRPDIDPVTFGPAVNGAYTRLDLAARWQALAWLHPYGRLENLADEDYEEALGFPAPGRTFVGGVSLTF